MMADQNDVLFAVQALREIALKNSNFGADTNKDEVGTK